MAVWKRERADGPATSVVLISIKVQEPRPSRSRTMMSGCFGRQGRAVLKHPLAHSQMAAGALCLGDDTGIAESGGEDGGQGITGGVMYRRVKADAMRTLHEVAAIGPMIGGAAGKSTGSADGVGEGRGQT